jgi:hypothetical protein
MLSKFTKDVLVTLHTPTHTHTHTHVHTHTMRKGCMRPILGNSPNDAFVTLHEGVVDFWEIGSQLQKVVPVQHV